jgi:creatinine amidohydrolase
MSDEVRYQMLRPSQVIARRKACPVAYVPIGTLEWHGLHNPLGADTLQAEALAIRCAEVGGGLAFPPLYYGESRSESLMEANAADREQIAACMELPPENFNPDRQPFAPMEQVLNYQKLLLHILAEVESLGFTLGVLVAGHYPLIDHARSAVLLFNKRRYSRYHGMMAWACLDYLPIADRFPGAGDHAGGWETSHLLAIAPETVDLSVLPPKGDKLVGVNYKIAPQDATAKLGRETLDASAEMIVKEVHHRLANRHLYHVHGGSLQEGLWKKDEKNIE